MTSMLFTIFMFFIKFALFALVWTYLGRFAGVCYLMIWIAWVIIKKQRNKKG